MEDDGQSGGGTQAFNKILEAEQPNESRSGANNRTYMERVHEIASHFKNLSDSEVLAFIEMMPEFEKLHTPKAESENCPPYKLKIKPHKNIIRKTYPVPYVHSEKVDKK